MNEIKSLIHGYSEAFQCRVTLIPKQSISSLLLSPNIVWSRPIVTCNRYIISRVPIVLYVLCLIHYNHFYWVSGSVRPFYHNNLFNSILNKSTDITY